MDDTTHPHGNNLTSVDAARGAASADVEAFLAALEHPFKPAILALRQIILGADSNISESVKWNAPSFRTTEHFATFQLRARDGVQIVLHRGAKARPKLATDLAIDDPVSLLVWHAPDRASVTFRNLEEIDARRSALVALIRQWIMYV